MAIIMERRLLLYTAHGAEGGHGGGARGGTGVRSITVTGTNDKISSDTDGCVKMERSPLCAPSASILIVRSLTLLPHSRRTAGVLPARSASASWTRSSLLLIGGGQGRTKDEMFMEVSSERKSLSANPREDAFKGVSLVLHVFEED